MASKKVQLDEDLAHYVLILSKNNLWKIKLTKYFASVFHFVGTMVRIYSVYNGNTFKSCKVTRPLAINPESVVNLCNVRAVI